MKDNVLRNFPCPPLLRMTFDWKENDIKMTQFVTGKAKKIAGAMGGRAVNR